MKEGLVNTETVVKYIRESVYVEERRAEQEPTFVYTVAESGVVHYSATARTM